METGRVEAFSDGVFAVAITLLALALAVPRPGDGSLGHQLANDWTEFAAYVVSFLTIGIIWVNHHALFRNFAHIDRPLLFINLLLLFFVVTIPFATATDARYLTARGTGASLAAVLYQAVFEGMSITFGVLFWWSITHDHFRVRMTPEQARSAFVRFVIGGLGYVVAIGVAFLSAPVSLLISGLVALYYVFERTPSGSTAAEQDADGA